MKKNILALLALCIGLNASALKAMAPTEAFNLAPEAAILGDFKTTIIEKLTTIFAENVVDFTAVGAPVFDEYARALHNASQPSSPLKRIYDLTGQVTVTKEPPLDNPYPNGKVTIAFEFFFALSQALVDAAKSTGATDTTSQRVKAYFSDVEHVKALMKSLEEVAPTITDNWYKRSFKALAAFPAAIAERVRTAAGPRTMPRAMDASSIHNAAPINMAALAERVQKIERTQSRRWYLITTALSALGAYAMDHGIETVVTLGLPGASALTSTRYLRPLADAGTATTIFVGGWLMKKIVG